MKEGNGNRFKKSHFEFITFTELIIICLEFDYCDSNRTKPVEYPRNGY